MASILGNLLGPPLIELGLRFGYFQVKEQLTGVKDDLPSNRHSGTKGEAVVHRAIRQLHGARLPVPDKWELLAGGAEELPR
jgi:hypothetical protein